MKKKGKINRRKFVKLTATGAATTGVAALMVYSDRLFTVQADIGNNLKVVPIDVKKTFMKCGACSHTFFHILNHEFGHPKENEERASDPLAGGLMSKQHQCGMLWGSALAAGAESFRRHNDRGQALTAAVNAAQYLVESFTERAKSVNCRDVIDSDISNKHEIAKFMLKSLPGGFNNIVCMNLAEKWAPEAIQAARKGLSGKHTDVLQPPVTCASEVARKMGASDEEMVTVAGLAGGIGLSGNACGALGAAIWMSSLSWCREQPGKSGYSNPRAEEILHAFYDATDSEILCTEVSGQHFKTAGDHSEFIKAGGCDKIINVLARS